MSSSSPTNSLDTDASLARYSRHILLPQIDIAGQVTLLNSTVMVVGLGGLGSAASMYLAAAGVGRLILVDPDTVELSNLQRQIIHDTDSVGRSKVVSAQQRLWALNPDIDVITHDNAFSAELLISGDHAINVIIDCTDNHQTRLGINTAAMQGGIPLIIGSAVQWSGQLIMVDPRERQAPCYQCLHRDQRVADVACAQFGVLSPLLGVIGSLQAVEALKALLSIPLRTGELLLYDSLPPPNVAAMSHPSSQSPVFETIRFSHWSECPCHPAVH